jgi:hypothetical protein
MRDVCRVSGRFNYCLKSRALACDYSFSKRIALSVTCVMLLSCLVCSSTVKLEATSSSEKSMDFRRATWRYIPEDRTLHNHRYENLKSYKLTLF